MRSAIALAALAAGVIAVPFADAEKRGIAIQQDIVYETKVVYVTAYGSAPVAPHYGHKTVVAPAPASTPSPSAAPVYNAPAPVDDTPAPVDNAPAPVDNAPAPVYNAPSSAVAPASGSPPNDYPSKVVYFHNVARANHSAPALEWDDDLYQCAKTIASSCVYEHNVDVNGGGYGQNIAAGVNEDNIGSVLIDMFFNNEMPHYTYYGGEPDMSDFDSWGHGSQMVWKSTTHVACATQYCPNGLANTGSGVSPYFTVCNYKTPGNYAGQYAENVLAPLGHPTISNDAPGY